jgi:hypothetical protein
LQAGSRRFESDQLHSIDKVVFRSSAGGMKPPALLMVFENLIVLRKKRHCNKRRGAPKGYGQVTKGARWMPRDREAMKDVDSCDKPRGAANRL